MNETEQPPQGGFLTEEGFQPVLLGFRTDQAMAMSLRSPRVPWVLQVHSTRHELEGDLTRMGAQSKQIRISWRRQMSS